MGTLWYFSSPDLVGEMDWAEAEADAQVVRGWRRRRSRKRREAIRPHREERRRGGGIFPCLLPLAAE